MGNERCNEVQDIVLDFCREEDKTFSYKGEEGDIPFYYWGDVLTDTNFLVDGRPLPAALVTLIESST